MAIVIGIVIGVVGLAIFIGLIEWVGWCFDVSKEIDRLQTDLEWETSKCGRLEVRCRKLEGSSDNYLKHGEAVLETLALIHNRVEALEQAKEKTDGNS